MQADASASSCSRRRRSSLSMLDIAVKPRDDARQVVDLVGYAPSRFPVMFTPVAGIVDAFPQASKPNEDLVRQEWFYRLVFGAVNDQQRSLDAIQVHHR